MNIRKHIDYSKMYKTLDMLMTQQLSQMELYCEIGKAVCRRTEKGAAVMASEYLNRQYPDVKGFSPRSLRRMRDFYHTYKNHPAILSRAMQLGWIQNVVIMEADLTMELREWYMRAAKQFRWSKAKLIAGLSDNAHEYIILDIEKDVCHAVKRKVFRTKPNQDVSGTIKNIFCRFIRNWWQACKVGKRRWTGMYGESGCFRSAVR